MIGITCMSKRSSNDAYRIHKQSLTPIRFHYFHYCLFSDGSAMNLQRKWKHSLFPYVALTIMTHFKARVQNAFSFNFLFFFFLHALFLKKTTTTTTASLTHHLFARMPRMQSFGTEFLFGEAARLIIA